MKRDKHRESGFYWVRFEGQRIVAEYTADGVGCSPEGPHWHVPQADECFRDREVCELLSGSLGADRLPPMQGRRSFPLETLWCPNPSQRRRVASGGARRTGWMFPPAVEKQLLRDCEGMSVLQLFGGQSSFGTKLDIDVNTKPHVIGDAWLPPFRQDSFDVVIMDPPYVTLNAQMKHALFCAANYIARRRVIWFSTIWTAASSGLSTEAAWLVRVGDSCNVRCLQYFTIRKKMQPVRYFKRGPQMKYNRWLAQPERLPFSEATVNA